MRTLAQATAYDPDVPDASRTPAYLSGAVHRNELPILLAVHDHDGEWQFLDGGAFDEEDALVLHLGHVFEEHPDLCLLADLPVGWAAERESVAGEWRRYRLPED